MIIELPKVGIGIGARGDQAARHKLQLPYRQASTRVRLARHERYVIPHLLVYPNLWLPCCQGGTPWSPGSAASVQPGQPPGYHTQTSPPLFLDSGLAGADAAAGQASALAFGVQQGSLVRDLVTAHLSCCCRSFGCRVLHLHTVLHVLHMCRFSTLALKDEDIH